MSLDYPDRSVWLAKRYTPARLDRGRFLRWGHPRARPHLGKSGRRKQKAERLLRTFHEFYAEIARRGEQNLLHAAMADPNDSDRNFRQRTLRRWALK